MPVPSLEHVQTFKEAEHYIEADDDIAQFWCSITEEMTDYFELGVARLTTEAQSFVHPDETKYHDGWDFACTVVEGELALSDESGSREQLTQYDFAYVPDGSTHGIENVGPDEAWIVWAGVPSADDNASGPSSVTWVDTFEEVDPGIGADEDDIKTYWIPVGEEILGVTHFSMGLISRPPGTEVPLHRHDPPEAREAFVTIEGTMGVNGRAGHFYEMAEYDAMYVPPYAQHANRNVRATELQYVFIESPSDPELVFQ